MHAFYFYLIQVAPLHVSTVSSEEDLLGLLSFISVSRDPVVVIFHIRFTWEGQHVSAFKEIRSFGMTIRRPSIMVRYVVPIQVVSGRPLFGPSKQMARTNSDRPLAYFHDRGFNNSLFFRSDCISKGLRFGQLPSRGVIIPVQRVGQSAHPVRPSRFVPRGDLHLRALVLLVMSVPTSRRGVSFYQSNLHRRFPGEDGDKLMGHVGGLQFRLFSSFGETVRVRVHYVSGYGRGLSFSLRSVLGLLGGGD